MKVQIKKAIDLLISDKVFYKIMTGLIGLIATIRLNIYLNQTRGYAAVGGEPLLIPTILILKWFFKKIKNDIKKANKDRESLKANQNKPKLSLSKNGGNING